MMNIPIAVLILLPLAGFLINFLFGKRMSKTMVGIVGSGVVLFAFILSAIAFFGIQSGEIQSSGHVIYPWFHAGDLKIDFNFILDPLSVLMLLIITGVGFLIHLYSIGYMHDDEGFHRYFAYLNLFVFFMQILVLGANFVITFIGWEGVGLCSYLLIGFWYKNQDYNDAAKKAFIMNRIGDLGFLIAMFLIYYVFGTLNFFTGGLTDTGVFGEAANFITSNNFDDAMIVLITILLFVGATGKSAQIPLFTWLPDAMAGPTPVSALIHAATMVTAGIYLIVRSHILFTLAPLTLDIIACIGLATAVFAATIAIAQNDIKKVLAYSTVSQLGYMFLALGLGAYTTAMFHLLTHAFFKALLFLGAGSVIHAMGGEQDMRYMGGLKKQMPATFWTMMVATIAISGIPPFAGFFSKDEILAHAFMQSPIIWGIAVLTSLLTAFYMFRLLFLTFYGKFRGTEHQRSHLHESPAVMTIPLIVLAILSAVGGFLGIPEVFGGGHALGEYLAPLFTDISAVVEEHHLSHSTELILMAVSVGLVLVMVFLAAKAFIRKEERADELAAEQAGFMKLLSNKYYVDEAYDALIVRPLQRASAGITRIIENGFIDGIVNGTAGLVSKSGDYVRRMQTGNIGFYLFAMVISIIILLLINSYII